MDVARRNNVTVTGNPRGRAVVLAHGFGCDQNMWRLTVPALAEDYRVVLFDYVGSGRSDPSAFVEDRYGSLDGYARDVVEVCEALDLRDAVFVGHSVSAMIGVLAAGAAPERIGALVMVAPSPRYIDDDGYRGGFSAEDIDELLDVAGVELPGLVGGDGPGDHGQRGAARTRRGAEEQFLRHRPGHGAGLRPHHVPVRLPGRPEERDGADAGPGMHPGRRSPRARSAPTSTGRSPAPRWSPWTPPDTARTFPRRKPPTRRSSPSWRVLR